MSYDNEEVAVLADEAEAGNETEASETEAAECPKRQSYCDGGDYKAPKPILPQRLNKAQDYRLTKWIESHLDEFAAKKLELHLVAERAVKELGFPVTGRMVRRIRESMVDIDPRFGWETAKPVTPSEALDKFTAGVVVTIDRVAGIVAHLLTQAKPEGCNVELVLGEVKGMVEDLRKSARSLVESSAT